MRTERCIRCREEDTDACKDCKLVQEDYELMKKIDGKKLASNFYIGVDLSSQPDMTGYHTNKRGDEK